MKTFKMILCGAIVITFCQVSMTQVEAAEEHPEPREEHPEPREEHPDPR
ncbi:hypothetical protein [Alteribacter aurantiacus]|nr:hypothetical protein [Alteribacter aurantiacus]